MRDARNLQKILLLRVFLRVLGHTPATQAVHPQPDDCKSCKCVRIFRTCTKVAGGPFGTGLSGILSQTFQGRPATVRPIFLL